MIDYLGMVREFHEKYGHYTQEKTGYPPEEIVRLRDKLIEEEFYELLDAENLTATADALADILYVTFGAALAYGIPIEEVFIEVHRSNMTKSMEKDTKSIKGKTIKGENYEPPNLERILNK